MPPLVLSLLVPTFVCGRTKYMARPRSDSWLLTYSSQPFLNGNEERDRQLRDDLVKSRGLEQENAT